MYFCKEVDEWLSQSIGLGVDATNAWNALETFMTAANVSQEEFSVSYDAIKGDLARQQRSRLVFAAADLNDVIRELKRKGLISDEEIANNLETFKLKQIK